MELCAIEEGAGLRHVASLFKEAKSPLRRLPSREALSVEGLSEAEAGVGGGRHGVGGGAL